MGLFREDVGLWWKVTARNKRSVTLDLRSPPGQAVARRLAAWADVVITNLRVGTVERWGLDWPSLHAVNPKLVMLQVSGYGATTTLRDAPGYGKVGEARSGAVHISGFPDGPPVHSGFSHADTVTGLMGAFAVQAATYRRLTDPDFDGEWIDLAVDETLFRLVESQIVAYDQLGVVLERVGNRVAGSSSALVNTFQASDGRWITVTSGTIASVQHIAELVGEPVDSYGSRELITANCPHLEERLAAWIAAHDEHECISQMRTMGVVAAAILDASDIVADETYRERGSIITVDDPDLGPLRMQGVVPRLANHTGDVWQAAPKLGEHTEQVLRCELGMSDAEIAVLTGSAARS